MLPSCRQKRCCLSSANSTELRQCICAKVGIWPVTHVQAHDALASDVRGQRPGISCRPKSVWPNELRHDIEHAVQLGDIPIFNSHPSRVVVLLTDRRSIWGKHSSMESPAGRTQPLLECPFQHALWRGDPPEQGCCCFFFDASAG